MEFLHKVWYRRSIAYIERSQVSGRYRGVWLNFALTHSPFLNTVIHLQFWANGSWDSLFPISLSPKCKLMSPKHYF